MSRKTAPDHGEYFVPGAEDAPSNRNPQSLDHFKRGYRERADFRERETATLNEDFRRKGRGGYNNSEPYPPHQGGGPRYERGGPRHGGPYNERRPGGGGDRGDGRGQVIMGLDVQALVDRLCRNPNPHDVFKILDAARDEKTPVFQSGKAVTAIISNLARRRNLRMATVVWDWIDSVGIQKNTFHYNSMISVCEKVRDYRQALKLLDEMRQKNVVKNEVTFSSAISACEKCGQWRTALDLLEQMKKEGAGQTAIAYNAAISACEKGLVPHKALEIFEQMKREGVRPTVVTYSALISAAEKGQQWKLALEVLEEMKAAGHGANVIAYSAAISALSKGQMWHKALELFREIEASGGKPSIVTYNATMTALEKGLQWERALDLFDEMKMKSMPITVVSYGSAISACEKGLQYRQCLEFLDEMTQMGIKKNVIIFGAAMSCMEKSCRADIAFQLMERMKHEDVAPNVHIYNSAISACARCNLWEKGYELFQEMDKVRVSRDVVSYNAVLDAVSSQIELGRRLFKEGVDKGFYSRVSRLGAQWLELDLHFLSLGGGEIALGWWFEECLVPYLINTSRLETVQSISIVTGYGKTRSRGARLNDDGMRLRVRAMLNFMKIKEEPQPNKGRIHINKEALIDEVKKNGGKIQFDLEGYLRWKEKETTANKFPDVPQQVRPRFRPARPGEGPPGTFVREGGANPSEVQNHLPEMDHGRMNSEPYPPAERRESRRDRTYDDRGGSNNHRPKEEWGPDRRASYNDRNSDGRGGSYGDDRRGGNGHVDRRGSYDDQPPRNPSYGDRGGNRSYGGDRSSYDENGDRRAGHTRDMDQRSSFDRRRPPDARLGDPEANARRESSHYGDGRRGVDNGSYGNGARDDYGRSRHGGPPDTARGSADGDFGRNGDGGFVRPGNSGGYARAKSEFPPEQRSNAGGYSRVKSEHPSEPNNQGGYPRVKSEYPAGTYGQERTGDGGVHRQGPYPDSADSAGYYGGVGGNSKKRPLEPPPNRGYNIEPAYSKRRNA